MVEKLSKEDQHFLDTGTDLKDAPVADPGDDRDPLDIAIEDDADDEPAASTKPAATAKTPAKDDPAAKPVAERPKPPEGYVEKGALDHERTQRKAAEKERVRIEREAAERFARLETRLQMLQEGGQTQRQNDPANAVPDPDVDPLAYIRHVGEQVGQLTQMTAQQRQQYEQQVQNERAWANVEQAYRTDAQNYAAENPDFGEAYQFLTQSVARELSRHPKIRGNPTALAQAMRQEELRIADLALSNGESPAEYLFGLAQDRGWVKQAPTPPPSQTNGNGQAARKPQTGAEQIERLAAAKDASTSLSQAGGAPGGNKLTLDDLDRMSDRQLQDFIRKKNSKDPHGYDKWMQRQMMSS